MSHGGFPARKSRKERRCLCPAVDVQGGGKGVRFVPELWSCDLGKSPGFSVCHTSSNLTFSRGIH